FSKTARAAWLLVFGALLPTCCWGSAQAQVSDPELAQSAGQVAMPASAPSPDEGPGQPAAVEGRANGPADSDHGWSPVFTGSYFTRYEARSGYDDAQVARGRFQDGDAVFYRLRLGIGGDVFDAGGLNVGFQFTPQVSGAFGVLPNTLSDADLGLHEGYLRVSGAHARVDSGRFELNYGDSLVLGNLDW